MMEIEVKELSPIEKEKLGNMIEGMSELELREVLSHIPVALMFDEVMVRLDQYDRFTKYIQDAFECLPKQRGIFEMAKNLRQKYKEAKKKLEAMNYKTPYPNSPFMVTNVPIRKFRCVRMVNSDFMPSNLERANEVIERDVARELLTSLLDAGVIDIFRTYDEYTDQIRIYADIYVADKKSTNAHA